MSKPDRPTSGFRPSVALASLIDRAAAEAGVPREVILGDARDRFVVVPRQRAMADAWLAGWSTTQTGLAFNRDHTTVLHAVKKRRAGEI